MCRKHANTRNNDYRKIDRQKAWQAIDAKIHMHLADPAGGKQKLEKFLTSLKRYLRSSYHGNAGRWLQTKTMQQWLKRTMPFDTTEESFMMPVDGQAEPVLRCGRHTHARLSPSLQSTMVACIVLVGADCNA
jgi:hypothetical protein